ncbi:hypothetical protein L2E82_02284 [Cichorium intybus]|uniref:Uncharacterized protein n=1 Tax=Cichorium intybus TaxID=13427 RepID=A0ACB9H188_CICIN|nr:hypothetical protein L2E82_02284 [Cichorium intybus]
MAPEDGAVKFKNTAQGSGDGGGGNDLTKGLWTPKEDALLAKYVMENGERKWNDLSRKFGLMRCGNSCRLRWFNHLRSNLKKEDFTPEEENKILKLHAKYGNRWSRLARHLPGRTDNEIKNFWNTRLKRIVRAGLPIYPPEILSEIRHRHLNHQQVEQPQQNHIELSSSLSLSSPQNPEFSSFPFSSYIRRISEVDVLNDDLVYFPPTGPPQALNLRSDRASTIPAIISNDIMAATCSRRSTTGEIYVPNHPNIYTP